MSIAAAQLTMLTGTTFTGSASVNLNSNVTNFSFTSSVSSSQYDAIGSFEHELDEILGGAGSTLNDCITSVQLQVSFQMGLLRGGLMGASPERPGDDVSGPDAALSQAHGDAADQETARPQAGVVPVIFGRVEIGQFTIDAVMGLRQEYLAGRLSLRVMV
ncbi:MAG: hypothetical protein ACREE4_21095 [Stellaceae bacterium]